MAQYRNRARFKSVLPVLLALVSIACSEPAVQHISLKVELLRNTPVTSEFALEEIADVEWVGDSTLFLSIDGGRELDLVRWDGILQRHVARTGQGPGEVLWAPWLLRRNDSTFVSIDLRQLRMSWWSASGNLVYESNFELPFIAGAWSTPKGIFLRAALSKEQWWYVWFNDSGSVVEKRGFTAEPISPNVTCSACAMAVSPHGSIAMGAADTSYRFLRTNSDGESLPVAGRPEVPRARFSASQQDSLAGRALEIEALMDRVDADDRTRARFKTRMYPEFLLPFRARSVFLDEEESLWVQRNVTGGDSAEVDLFDRQSAYLGTIRFAPGTILRRVQRGRVLVSHIDDEFRTTIAEYRLLVP